MMNQGRVNRLVQIQVLKMLKSQICDPLFSAKHGDIKDIRFFNIRVLIVIWKTEKTAR